MHRYDLIALDLDGTLLDPRGRVSDANSAAIARARAAGVMVTICTGRAFVESKAVIDAVGQTDPVIVAGGALVCHPRDGATIERFAMPPGLIAEIAAYLHDRGHPALLLKDAHAAGFDYLVISPRGPHALDAATTWWFRRMGIQARFAPSLSDDAHPEHTIRIGAYAADQPVDQLAADLRARFGTQTMLQHFNGVLHALDGDDRDFSAVHIVELFDPLADKWQALRRLAASRNIPESRIAAVGDQSNDLSMISHAGLGVAMGNATATVKAAADRETLPCEQDGVAHAIDRILAGEW